MACSPEGSQSVWKRTLSAAPAGDANAYSAKAAAIRPKARVTSLIGGLLTRHGSGARGLSRPSRARKINTLRRRGWCAVHTGASFRAGKQGDLQPTHRGFAGVIKPDRQDLRARDRDA